MYYNVDNHRTRSIILKGLDEDGEFRNELSEEIDAIALFALDFEKVLEEKNAGIIIAPFELESIAEFSPISSTVFKDKYLEYHFN